MSSTKLGRAAKFLGLMSKFVDAFNSRIRTPILPPEGM